MTGIIARLVAEGVSPALIEDIAMALARAEADRELIEGRRAKDRARKAVPRNSTEGAEIVEFQPTPSPLSPPLKSPPDPQKITPPITPQPHCATALRPEHVVEAWNEMAARLDLPIVKKLSDQRLRKLRIRLREHSIEDFTEAISAIERSSFLHGEGRNGWRANFDFLLQASSFQKLIEGNYDRPN